MCFVKQMLAVGAVSRRTITVMPAIPGRVLAPLPPLSAEEEAVTRALGRLVQVMAGPWTPTSIWPASAGTSSTTCTGWASARSPGH
jgi:hypothetical protein